MNMHTDERIWNIQRVYKQLEDEKKAVEEAQRKLPSSRKKR